MKNEAFTVINLEFIRQLCDSLGQSDAAVTSIEVDGEVTLVVEGKEPPVRIRDRVEAGNRSDSVDGHLYAVRPRYVGEPMKTFLVSAGRMPLQDMYGVEAAPVMLADGPVRLQYYWRGSDCRYEINLRQLGDLLVEIVQEAGR